jgi:prevent-host-death family protein
MSETFSVDDAEVRLSELVDRASQGEDVIISRDGRPVARLIAFRPKPAIRKAGRMRGAIRVARNFDAPFPDGVFEGAED